MPPTHAFFICLLELVRNHVSVSGIRRLNKVGAVSFFPIIILGSIFFVIVINSDLFSLFKSLYT